MNLSRNLYYFILITIREFFVMLSYQKQQKNTISTSVYKTWIHLLANTLGFVTLRIGSDEGRIVYQYCKLAIDSRVLGCVSSRACELCENCQKPLYV